MQEPPRQSPPAAIPANLRNSGGNTNYYLVRIAYPKRGAPYMAECEDIIAALGMTFEEGCAFKALWRRCAARTLGIQKAGYDGEMYDAEKQLHYSARSLLMLKLSDEEPTAGKLEALASQIIGLVASSTGLDPRHVPAKYRG